MNILKSDNNLSSIVTSVIFRQMAFLFDVLEKITATHKVCDKVQTLLCLECIMEPKDKWILHIKQNLPLLHSAINKI